MPAAWTLAVAVLLAAAGPAPADEPKPVSLPLTVFDVLQLAQQGTPDDAILAQLRDTNTTCPLSPNDVSMLKLFGVSDRVVKAMTGAKPVVSDRTYLPPSPAQPFVLPPPSPSVQAASTKPLGSWVREAGPLMVRVTFAADRVTGTVAFDADGERVNFSFDADYTVNREGLLYGVVTGVDCDDPEGGAFLQSFAGHTFSMRCRCDGDVLSVREVKFCGSGLKDRDDEMSGVALTAAGRYRKDDGTPRPKAAGKKPPVRLVPADLVVPAGRREVVPGPTAPAVERLGIDFNQPSQFGALPPPPPPPPMAAGPRFGTPAGPFPPMTPFVPSGPAGTWVRDRPGVRVTMKLTDRRLKLDVAFAAQEGTEVQRGTWRLDADCAVGPDGSVFGVITGADLTPADDTPADKAGDAAAVGAMANKFVGELFRFRYRVDDGELSVRELKVSLPDGKLDDEAMAAMSLMLAGRYQAAGEKPWPPVKPGVVVPVRR